MEQQIRTYAEMVIQQMRPLSRIEFGYTRESVEWLEGFIERLRESGESESFDERNKLTTMFGSFLGECITRCYGGTWKQDESGVWCVAFDDRNAAFPFAKVEKQMDNVLPARAGRLFGGSCPERDDSRYLPSACYPWFSAVASIR